MAGQQICEELLYDVTGNAVDIARSHKIDLHCAFNSVGFRGEDGEGILRARGQGRGKVVDKGGEGERKIVLEGGKGLKVVVAREKKAKGEGGAVARVGSKGEGCGGPKFVEKAGDNTGRQRGEYVCCVCIGMLVY